jgi:predicted RNA binding protein YcfA (HicA-like mRNA interferase family)
MPFFGAISRRALLEALQKAGFEGPFIGKRHAYMRRGTVKLIIPNPHKGDIGVDLLHRILRQAGISRDEWESL